MKGTGLLILVLPLWLIAYAVSAQDSKYDFELMNTFEADAAFYGTPLVTDTSVVIGSHDKYVYFFNHQGELMRRFETGSFVHATASQLEDGRVVIGSYDRYLYFFTPDGHFLQKRRIGGRIFTNVVENMDGRLVFGCNNSLVFLNAGSMEI
ncbi:MAG: hypothetical protein ACOCXO_04620, partial [Bacteroidota bacterium]